MEARRHMLAGIERLSAGAWSAALVDFDAAIRLREATDWQASADSAWLLAAAWINRSDALRFLGKPEEGIESLDRAIAAMQFVPLAENPGYAQRLVLAWVNRGTACGEAGRAEEALAAFSRAEESLREFPGVTGRELLASMLHANRARVFLEMGTAQAAWRDSRRAIECLDGLEITPVVVDAAIQARGIHCRALAALLEEPGGSALEEDWIATATDRVEEALALVKASGYRGEWLAGLVRYGAKIYRICQPHFLAEFLIDWLGPDGPLAGDRLLRQEMQGEILLAQAELEMRFRRHAHDPVRTDRAMRVLRSLQHAARLLAD